MALDVTAFETIIPSRFISFTIPYPNFPNQLLRIAVLDSPIEPTDSPRAAALVVPQNRESDWIFSTEFGHIQLLLSTTGFSRLILIGKNPIDAPNSFFIYNKKDSDAHFAQILANNLKSLLFALSPKVSVQSGNFDIPIVDYEDNVVSSVVLEKCVGVLVGEMLVEDVEIESGSKVKDNSRKREFRRRLRFKRMPNLVQTEIPIVLKSDFSLDCIKIGEVEFRPDIGVLVHPYLIPMVAGLSLLSFPIGDEILNGFKSKALCLGVGGGALLSFLRTQLGFDVFGVEMDEQVLRVARQYFGLEVRESQVFVGDAIAFLEVLASRGSSSNLVPGEVVEDYLKRATGFDAKFDVIMVDLDCCDARTGISSPPLEFIQRHILSAASSVLSEFGILIMNVIPPSRSFYDTILNKFLEFFHELYEIDVGNAENFVLIAKMVPLTSSVRKCDNAFIQKLRDVTLGKYIDSIRKVER